MRSTCQQDAADGERVEEQEQVEAGDDAQGKGRQADAEEPDLRPQLQPGQRRVRAAEGAEEVKIRLIGPLVGHRHDEVDGVALIREALLRFSHCVIQL
jgi:hypothetical protein